MLRVSYSCRQSYRWVVGALQFVLASVAVLVAVFLFTISGYAATLTVSGDNLVGQTRWTEEDAYTFIARGSTRTGPEITVTSTIVFDQVEDSMPMDSLWLAGVAEADEAAGARPLVVLAWERDDSGFWPTWRLVLASSDELDTQVDGWRRGSDQWEGYIVKQLAIVQPVEEHGYDTALSYDAASGLVSIAVQDATSGASVCSGSYRLAGLGGPLVPLIGVRKQPGQAVIGIADLPVRFERFAAYPVVAPVGFEWEVEAKLRGETNYTPALGFDTQDDVRVRVWGLDSTFRGSYRVTLVHDGVEKTVGIVPGGHDSFTIPIDLTDVPLGASTLQVAYEEDGRILVADGRQVTVGSAAVVLDSVAVSPTRETITANVLVRPHSKVGSAQLTVDVALCRLTWNPTTRSYQEHDVYQKVLTASLTNIVAESQVSIPFTIDLPDKEPSLWRVALRPALQPRLLITTGLNERLVSTYNPATIEPSARFTIVVLPDAQYATRNFPEVFTRQTQWVAEKAAALNIAAVLHLGDITDHNLPEEWQRARESMGVLSGVVPYVLAIGNHDFLSNGRLLDRRDTLAEKYFPLESFPAICGTFETGSLANAFYLFEVAGKRYMVLALEFGPRDEVLDWANEVVDAHPDYQVIVITHMYSAVDGKRLRDPSQRQEYPQLRINDGEDMWRKFVSRHENIFLVLSGHTHTEAVPRQVARGIHGNPVFEVLMDYQFESNGGNGWLGLLEFAPDGKVKVRVYSPYLDEYKESTDKYGFNSAFTIDVQEGRVITDQEIRPLTTAETSL